MEMFRPKKMNRIISIYQWQYLFLNARMFRVT